MEEQRTQAFGELMHWIEFNSRHEERNVRNREVGAGGKTDRHDNEKKRQTHVIDAAKNCSEIKPGGRECERCQKKKRDDEGQPDPMQRQRIGDGESGLTENAIKYNTQSGSVTVGLRRRYGFGELRVCNTEPGVPPEKLPRVFDRFYRCDAAHTNQIDGCGLGLSIAQWIVRAHGGTIKVDSKVGNETTLLIRLPALWKNGVVAALL